MIEIEKPPQLKNFGLGRFFWIAGTVLCAWLALPLASSHYEWHKGLPTELAILELRALVALVIQIWLVALRLKSIGWNRWYSVAMVIPFVSLWIGAVCIVCPPNYRTNKQFDPGPKLNPNLLRCNFFRYGKANAR